jgi:hypothetical protein
MVKTDIKTMTRSMVIAAIGVVALTVGARAEDKPSGPHGYIIFCGIVPGTCVWLNGEGTQQVPMPHLARIEVRLSPGPNFAFPRTIFPTCSATTITHPPTSATG